MNIKAKGLMALQGLAWYIAPQKKLEKSSRKSILIILELPGIGDIVLCLRALYNFYRFINEESEYDILFAASPIICDFLKNTKSTFDMTLVEVDFTFEHRSSFSVFKDNYSKLNKRYYDYIISFDSLSGYTRSLIMGLSYNKIIFSEDRIKKYFIKDIVYKFLLHDVNLIKVNYSGSVLTHKSLVCKKVFNEALVKIIGLRDDSEYKMYDIPILSEEHKIAFRNYCVFAAGIAKGHDYPYRGWNIEKFADVANYILEKTDLKICLCGSHDDKSLNRRLYNLIKIKERVIDLTSKTSFAEWVEILRNAEFVFGNDSGYIHLATVLKTKTFVIAGFWNYGRFLPYKNIECSIVPIDIRTSIPKCVLCNFVKTNCKEKIECDKKVRESGIYKCVDDITSKMAIEAVKRLYIDKEDEVYIEFREKY